MDFEDETNKGLTFLASYAMIANRYFYEYRNVKKEMGMCAVHARVNAKLNPDAQMRKEISLTEILAANMIADPFSLYDCPPITDGAAFVVLAASDIAEGLTSKHRIVDVAGSGHAGDALTLMGKKDFTSFASTSAAAKEAYEQAGLEPKDIQFAEVHDCFTISQIISTEDLGFFEAGKGGDAVAEGKTARTGSLPVNVSGGLKAKGYPIGAAGISQIYEAVTQIRGEAGTRQLERADIGLTHNLGGTAGTCVVHIFRGR
jgi:acetyl-CoA acetyltransferase